MGVFTPIACPGGAACHCDRPYHQGGAKCDRQDETGQLAYHRSEAYDLAFVFGKSPAAYYDRLADVGKPIEMFVTCLCMASFYNSLPPCKFQVFCYSCRTFLVLLYS
jgi:hypothetical protein